MISIKPAIQQMAWADAKLFDFLLTLPEDVWQANTAEDEWDVVHLTFHMIASADWYRYQLGGQLKFTTEPTSVAEVKSLGEQWQEINSFLIEQCDEEDGIVYWVEDGVTFSTNRAAVLNQALIHAVEHRTQIMSILKEAGVVAPPLEDFSVWGYLDK